MEFKECFIKDFVDTISDTTPIVKEKVVLINTSDVENGKVLNHLYTENSNLKGQFKKRFKKEDILYSEIRPQNKRFAYVDFDSSDYIASTKLMVLRNKGNINNKFLFYILKSEKVIEYLQMLAESRSGTFPQITFEELGNVKIKVPCLLIQEKIVKILEDIDKKIELNNQINENLFEIGKNLFDKSLNLENSEKKSLEEVCFEITRGYTKNYIEKSNIINLNQKVNKGKILEKQYFKYLDENQEIPQNRFVRKNDILLNSLGQGTLGRVHLYKENTDNIVIDQHITIIRTDNSIINPYYLYYLLISNEYQSELEGLVTGTTGMQMLNISAVRELKIPIPNKEKIDAFEENVKWIFEKINSNNLENENLVILRDTLLPKLMNGEIDLEKINC